MAEVLQTTTTNESIAVEPQWAELPGGGRVQYEVFGKSGPFVFLGPHIYLTPMVPDAAAICQGYVDALSDRYRVIVADILAIADAAGADQFAWWGYSFGGAAGLQLAARTGRLSALVVGSYPPLWQPFSDMLLTLHMAEDDLQAAEAALTARGWEIQSMETGKAHMGMSEYQKNLAVFAPFLDRVLLGKSEP